MNRRVFLSGVAALIVGSRLLAAMPADEPKVDLRPQFAVGQENRFQVTMVSRTTTQFLDTPRVRLQEYQQNLRVRRKVIAADSTGATLELVYEKVGVTLIAANKTISFDSAGINPPEAEEVLGPTARNALNRPFTIKVDSYGRVLSVSGNEQDGARMAAVNLIDTDILSRLFAPMYGIGKEPTTAALGETWSNTRRSKQSKTGTFVFTVESKLASLTGDRANIEIGGAVGLEMSDIAKEGNAELASHAIIGHQMWNVPGGVIDRSFYQQSIAVMADVEAKQPLQDKGEIRRRRADMLLYVAIDRIDEGVSALPSLPPVPEAVAAPVRPREIPAEPALPDPPAPEPATPN